MNPPGPLLPAAVWFQPPIVAAVAGLTGILLSFVLQRFSDLVKPPARLLQDLKDKTLGQRGIDRLQPIALLHQKRFADTFDRPDSAYLIGWNQENYVIFVTPADGALRTESPVHNGLPQRQSILIKLGICAELDPSAESAIESELNAILKAGAESVGTFSQVLKLAKPEEPVLVIVECLGITVRRSQSMVRLFDLVKAQIQPFFSEVKIGLALHASDEVVEEGRRLRRTPPLLIVLPRRNDSPVSVQSAAHEYALLRNSFSVQLAKGIVLGRRTEHPNMTALARETMIELAHARLKDKDLENLIRLNGKNAVGTICIWGPPASENVPERGLDKVSVDRQLNESRAHFFGREILKSGERLRIKMHRNA